MRSLSVVALLSALVLPVLVHARQSSETVVILVRHAEKSAAPADDPVLTAEGTTRARALWDAVRGAGIDAIITTNLTRTRATAAPTASALGITPEVLKVRDPKHVQQVVDAIKRHAGHTVLVVGHADTVPEIIAALGAARLRDICDNVYDNLFIVTIGHDGKARLIRARYGAPSPVGACAAM
jgi:broad specificity phosphatase PhoE